MEQVAKSIKWLRSDFLALNSLMGFVCLLLVGLSLAGFFEAPSYELSTESRWLIANLFFFNTVHVVFTFLLLRSAPEFSYRLQSVSKKQKFFIPILIVACIAMFIVFYGQSNPYLDSASKIFLIVVPQFHVLSQIKGLCLNLLEKSRWTDLARTLWRWAIPFSVLSALTQLVNEPIYIEYPIIITAWIIFGALIYASFRALKISNEGLHSYGFHIRLLLFPLSYINPLAGYLIICVHGIEYIAVVSSQVKYRDIIKNDRIGFAFFLALSTFMIVVTWLASVEGRWTFAGNLSNALMMSTVVAHYGLDGILFRNSRFYSLT
jgi:hypothetical protein